MEKIPKPAYGGRFIYSCTLTVDAEKVKVVYFVVKSSAYLERSVEALKVVDHTGSIIGTTDHVKNSIDWEPTTGIENSTS